MAVKPAWLWNRKGTESGLIKLRVRGVYWARQQRSVVFILYIYMFFVCFYLYLMSNIACRFVFISYICWADEHDVLCLDSEFVFEKSYLLTNHVCISFVEQASKLLSHLWDCNQKIDASQTFEGTPKERFCICLDYSTYISKNATKDCWRTLNLLTEHCQRGWVHECSNSISMQQFKFMF